MERIKIPLWTIAHNRNESEQSLLPLNLGKRSHLARTAVHSPCRCNVFASIQFTKAIKIKEIDMECPRCQGIKIIHVRAVPGVHQQYDVECPVCGGTGELPDSAELPNHCPVCGEPVRAGETWCDRHKPAEQLE
jgi:ribosomal protein S27E